MVKKYTITIRTNDGKTATGEAYGSDFHIALNRAVRRWRGRTWEGWDEAQKRIIYKYGPAYKKRYKKLNIEIETTQ